MIRMTILRTTILPTIGTTARMIPVVPIDRRLRTESIKMNENANG